jgi:hypothetical protein
MIGGAHSGWRRRGATPPAVAAPPHHAARDGSGRIHGESEQRRPVGGGVDVEARAMPPGSVPATPGDRPATLTHDRVELTRWSGSRSGHRGWSRVGLSITWMNPAGGECVDHPQLTTRGRHRPGCASRASFWQSSCAVEAVAITPPIGPKRSMEELERRTSAVPLPVVRAPAPAHRIQVPESESLAGKQPVVTDARRGKSAQGGAGRGDRWHGGEGYGPGGAAGRMPPPAATALLPSERAPASAPRKSLAHSGARYGILIRRVSTRPPCAAFAPDDLRGVVGMLRWDFDQIPGVRFPRHTSSTAASSHPSDRRARRCGTDSVRGEA